MGAEHQIPHQKSTTEDVLHTTAEEVQPAKDDDGALLHHPHLLHHRLVHRSFIVFNLFCHSCAALPSVCISHPTLTSLFCLFYNVYIIVSVYLLFIVFNLIHQEKFLVGVKSFLVINLFLILILEHLINKVHEGNRKILKFDLGFFDKFPQNHQQWQ